MSTQEDIAFLKSIKEWGEKKGVKLSFDDAIHVLSTRTGQTIGLQAIDKLRKEGYINAVIVYDGQKPAGAQAIEITKKGKQLLSNCEQPTTSKDHWLMRLPLVIGGTVLSVFIGYFLLVYKPEVNNLKALLQEYETNLRIITDIATDEQYIEGKMKAQNLSLSSQKYKDVDSKGIIFDEQLRRELQDIYTNVFEVINTRLERTHNFSSREQINQYKLIGITYEKNKDMLNLVQAELQRYVQNYDVFKKIRSAIASNPTQRIIGSLKVTPVSVDNQGVFKSS